MSYEIHVKPRAERQAIITKALEASDRKDRLDDYRGEPIDLKVVSLEIGLPVYRMANCRTFSEQQNSIAKKVGAERFRSLLWFNLSLLPELLHCQEQMASFSLLKDHVRALGKNSCVGHLR